MSCLPLRYSVVLLAASAALRAQDVKLTLEPAERIATPIVDPASDAAQQAIQRFKVPDGLKVSLWAAEPMLANPVAFTFDEKGRLFVSETHRYRTSVLDIRGYMGMLEGDLASRTIEDRSKLIHSVFGEEGAKQLAVESELLRLVEDQDGDGVADHSSIFATGFNSELDGIASGVLAYQGKVWFTDIPSLWQFDTDASGAKETKRTELLRGFGIHFNYTGHDLHGLIMGPDGKIYFSIGDRGTHVVNKEGKLIDMPDTGATFRCNPDGTEFEVFAFGQRNPQELAFDEYGNLFTGDNDCDNGDLERLVYVVEGGDSGWRIGYQHAPLGKAGPWMRDDLWKPRFEGQPAYLLPPICNIEDGPSGVAYYPGTGLTPAFNHTFFICHFKGSISRSGVQSYKIKEDGAGFQIVDSAPFFEGLLPTDVTFGTDGRLYVADWVEGWPKSKKGRVYAISAEKETPAQKQQLAELKKLFFDGMKNRGTDELTRLLSHADMRIRQNAQFELAARGPGSIPVFEKLATDGLLPTIPRLHALWGLGQLAKANPQALAKLPGLLANDKDAEVRAQSAKLLGDHHVDGAYDLLVGHLEDKAPRVAFFSAQSLGKLKRASAVKPLIQLLRRNADKDVYLRHAAVYALSQIGATPELAAAAKDSSSSVRLGVLLVYRRLGDPAIAQFLDDKDLYLVREAALAINDAPVNGAMAALAAKLETAPVNDEPIMFRTINAHYRLGGAENAKALAHFAARSDVPDTWRDEALTQLGLWGTPPARDRIIGLYRPLPARDGTVAVSALQPVVLDLLQHAPIKVRLATLSAISALKMHSASADLHTLVADEEAAPEVRAAALGVLDAFNDPHLNDALKIAGDSKAPATRLAALQILARRSPEAALPVVSRLAEDGNEREQRAAFEALGKLDLPKASEEIVAALDHLSNGKVAPGAQVELLDVAQKSQAPDVQARYQKLQADWAASSDVLAPYRSALIGGNPRKGAITFYQNPVMACVRCHKVDGEGGDAGPDLSVIGAEKSPEYLLESVVKPNAKIAAGFDIQTVTLKNGSYESGSLLSENAKEIVLKRADGTKVAIPTSDVKSRQTAPSAMPEIFTQVLSRTELRDVVAYLRTLTERTAEPEKEEPRALAALHGRPLKPAAKGQPLDNGEAPTTSQH
ncbi:MAG TPA: HEAT repeat domain-containing protein [Opitutaceae bacterium]|nr:HEAT repeat domain-containing protein [Opitutaceae bacterium]